MDQREEAFENLSVSKSNDMISAKFKSTLLEHNIMNMALAKIEINTKDKEMPLEARLYPSDLKRVISDEAHIYRDLKKVAKTIIGHTMFIEDKHGNFKAFAIVPNAEYTNGEFVIKFNNELRNHILGINAPFTTLELSVMTSFQRAASFRIYELLKKHMFKSKPSVNMGRVDVEINLSELRFMIGIANIDDQGVKNEMARMGNKVDWDLLYSKLDKSNKKYVRFAEFKRNVLNPAQEELAEKSDIRFDYEAIRIGHSISSIVFHVYKNIPDKCVIEKKQILEKSHLNCRQLEFPKDTELFSPLFEKYEGHKVLIKEDIELLLRKANYDAKKVERAIELADKQKHLRNYVGWIVKCIEDGYEEIPVSRGSVETAKKEDVVYEKYQNTTKEEKESIDESLLTKTKQKEEYPNFIEFLEENGVEEQKLEILYTPGEIVQMFVDWKLGREINF